ncbi:hypothetical protein JW835_07260 [bacterium]|nr:hypothetical protein [bacterium]
MKKNKKIDCVKMTREIRDKLFEQHKELTTNEFAHKLIEDSHKSPLWMKMGSLPK